MARFPESFGVENQTEKKDDTTNPKKKKSLGRVVASGASRSEQANTPAETLKPPKRFSEAFADILKKPQDTKPQTAEKSEPKQPPKPEKVDVSQAASQAEADVAQPANTGQAAPTESVSSEKPVDSTPEAAEQHNQTVEEVEADAAVATPKTDTQERGRERPLAEQTERDKASETDQHEARTQASNESYDFPTRELDAETGELSAGEGVIHLNGSGPIAEHVVPLHANEAAHEPPEVVARRAAFQAAQAGENVQPQPEQQHRAQDAKTSQARSEATPPAPEVGNGGGGEMPPTGPPEQGGATPERPEPNRPEQSETRVIQPEETDISYAGGQTPNAGPSISPSERPATKQELDQAFARNAQVHEQRGLLSGLLFGVWFANRRLRRRQKQTGKELKYQGRQLENLTKQFNAASNVQERQQVNSDHRFSNVEKRFENQPAAEKSELQKQTEQLRRAVETKAPEKMTLPPNHRLETSAWHAIEVDSKTGKPVETPSFQYGHEYYRERAHESGPADQRSAVAGELAVIAATGASVVNDQKTKDSTAKAEPNATKQSSPSGLKDKAKDTAKSAITALQKNNSNSQAGPIWPWVVALVAVIVVLVLLVH